MASNQWEHRLDVIHLGGKNDGAAARADAVSTLGALGQAAGEGQKILVQS